MNNQYMQFITQHILAVSCLLIGCADPKVSKIIHPPIQKTELLIDTPNQQNTNSHHTSSITYGEPSQLTLDNTTTEVTQYLQELQKTSTDYIIQHPEQYQLTGKRLLQKIEEFKKSQKKAYRMADRNFLYNTDVSSEGMCLLDQQMKNNRKKLRSLRDLRGHLLQSCHFSQQDLRDCHVKIKPSQDGTEEYEIDSSDEEKLTYSRGELAFRKGGFRGIKQGIVEFPRHFFGSIKSMLLDKESTIDKLTDYLIETPDVSDQLAEYMDTTADKEEEKGKEVGEWITSQILVGISEMCQASLIKDIGKIKLIKALLKVVRAKRQQASKQHKLTQKGLKQIEKLVVYQNQSAQEILRLFEAKLPTPPVQHKSYWNKSLSELANLAAKDDEDAKAIVEFLKKELQNM